MLQPTWNTIRVALDLGCLLSRERKRSLFTGPPENAENSPEVKRIVQEVSTYWIAQLLALGAIGRFSGPRFPLSRRLG